MNDDDAQSSKLAILQMRACRISPVILMSRWLMSSMVKLLSLCTLLFALQPPAYAQAVNAGATKALTALLPSYQDDYGYWRQQVRVASPTRRARWDRAPAGAVRVYHRRFDARWNWRSSPRHRVVYTYSRGDLWFLDPTTGWAYSVDRYGIVYTADPYRGSVYSLGPLTRWTADLLYFFDLYRFNRGYWYCSDYDYFVDLWEGSSRYGYYTYDTAYSTVWEWEPYFSSPTFISYSNRFSTVWVRQVRNHYDYIERNPVYRRELIDSIGLPAVNAVPPRMVSPRAVATSAYWEARDLAGAGMRPPPRGRDEGRSHSVAAGTLVDAQRDQARVVDLGSQTPGFNAPFPDGSYGFGVRPGRGEAGSASEGLSGARGSDDGAPAGRADSAVATENAEAGQQFGRADAWGNAAQSGGADSASDQRSRMEAQTPPQFEEPAYTPPVKQPQYEQPALEAPRDNGRFGRDRDADQGSGSEDQQRFERSREEPRFEAPREEPREEPRFEAPREERREEPRFEAPREERREEPRFEAPREERREEPSFEAREEPRYEAAREEPREEPREERQRDEKQEERS